MPGLSGWDAPEVRAGGEQTLKVDIFAFGLCMWCVLVGAHNPGTYDLWFPPGVCGEARGIVEGCVRPTAAERPSTVELLGRLAVISGGDD